MKKIQGFVRILANQIFAARRKGHEVIFQYLSLAVDILIQQMQAVVW